MRDPSPDVTQRPHLSGACAVLGLTLLGAQAAIAADSQRTLLELFTSTGCSSCPPADAIAGRLSTNPAVIVLSFHVTYWDSPEWKDRFASAGSTDRQYAYAHALGEHTAFTPQVVVNGTHSLIGSQESAIEQAVQAESRTASPVQVDLRRQADGSFTLNMQGPAVRAEVWEVAYVRHAVTEIRGGENRGRTLDTYNNVTRIHDLGAFMPGTRQVPPLKSPEDGLAVFVQVHGLGRILGASAY
jgi:hypothetical protein